MASKDGFINTKLGLGVSDDDQKMMKKQKQDHVSSCLTLGLSPVQDVDSCVSSLCWREVDPRKKLRLTNQQSATLEDTFKRHSTLNPKQKQVLAAQLNLRPRQVEVWFQNRRARTKVKQTEEECEVLRKCCETLREENKRLQKELRVLKLRKTVLFMKPTLTNCNMMCPSCHQRINVFNPLTHPSQLANHVSNYPNRIEKVRSSLFLSHQDFLAVS